MQQMFGFFFSAYPSPPHSSLLAACCASLPTSCADSSRGTSHPPRTARGPPGRPARPPAPPAAPARPSRARFGAQMEVGPLSVAGWATSFFVHRRGSCCTFCQT